ncbi:MAG: thiamine phosphate synthase [Sphingomonadales bacterium]
MSGDSHDIAEFGREPRDPCALYLISPPAIVLNDFLPQLQQALAGGAVACFQLRLKDADDDTIIAAAKAVKPVLDAHDVALVINDRADIAAQVDADAVHLGQEDGDVRAARELLGFDKAIGVTCHDSRHLAMLAGEAGADYVAFGAFFPTTTKAPKTRATPEILRWWTALSELPCVAIGGITAANCGDLVQAGADMIAVSSAVWDHPEGPQAAVRELNAAIATASA